MKNNPPTTPLATDAGPTRVNIGKLALVLIGLSVIVPLASAGILLGVRPEANPAAALMAIVPSVIGAIVGLVLLTSIKAQTASAGTFTLICLVGGASRMFSSIAIALAVYLMADPAKMPFWGAFLVTGLVVLIAETVLLMSASSTSPKPVAHAPSNDEHDATANGDMPEVHIKQGKQTSRSATEQAA